MQKKIQKSFKECISKIKIPNKQIHFRFRSCKQPKTPSFGAGGNGNGNEAVSLTDIDRFLFENFRSLYQNENGEETVKRGGPAASSFPFDSPRLMDPPPPENLCGSARFFVASGSSTSLITDEICSSSASAGTNDFSVPEETEEISGAAKDSHAPDDFIAILTYSPSPYDDFRRSMQEMVEARLEHNGKVDWEFMEELLFCYLDLNNKKSYRFILHAFVDLVVVLRENSGTIPGSRQPRSGGGGKKQLKDMHA